MINLYENKRDCCACSACMSICPKNAIKMDVDEYGFIYPNINLELCIECRACKTVCDFQERINKNNCEKKPLETYAAILKNNEMLMNSASGGAFVALANYILYKGGIVCGCTMDENLDTRHICIDKKEDIKQLQGSKYIQSSMNDTFKKVKKYLTNKQYVLFTGTPCQVAGLKKYLNRDYENLITADLICHGVPSSSFFKGYIKWLEKSLNSKVTNFKFRDKKYGWGLLSKVQYKKNGNLKSKTMKPILSYYYQYFIKGDIYRDSCYQCPYASSHRIGDFTIGDYWGIEKYHPEIQKSKGVSLLLANTLKSINIIKDDSKENKLVDYIYLTKSEFSNALEKNEQLTRPAEYSNKREAILTTFKNHGFDKVATKYYKEMKKEIFIFKIKSFLPRNFKYTINKVLKSK